MSLPLVKALEDVATEMTKFGVLAGDSTRHVAMFIGEDLSEVFQRLEMRNDKVVSVRWVHALKSLNYLDALQGSALVTLATVTHSLVGPVISVLLFTARFRRRMEVTFQVPDGLLILALVRSRMVASAKQWMAAYEEIAAAFDEDMVGLSAAEFKRRSRALEEQGVVEELKTGDWRLIEDLELEVHEAAAQMSTTQKTKVKPKKEDKP